MRSVTCVQRNRDKLSVESSISVFHEEILEKEVGFLVAKPRIQLIAYEYYELLLDIIFVFNPAR